VPQVRLRIIAAFTLIALLVPSVTWGESGAPDVTVDADTEAVINGSLKWLAVHQQPSGSFMERNNQAAITGYTLLAFMAAGNLPDEGTYGKAVGNGARFLLNCVRSDGYIIAPVEVNNDKGMYGHGIATIALAELYGQTTDPNVHSKLERAVHLIVSTQNPQGGWRYFPRIMDADISVTVLQIVALRAAMNDGIEVPRETVDRAVNFVRMCRAAGPSGGFAYMPGGGPGFARTAAAVYSLQVCGLYDDPMVADGSQYLFKWYGRDSGYFTYGNFYAAPAQYMIGGDTWRRWYPMVKQTLLQRVQRDGEVCSWPILPGDASARSDVYVTAVNTMILAMPYHYIPLYQR
jgi:hypothetical protein